MLWKRTEIIDEIGKRRKRYADIEEENHAGRTFFGPTGFDEAIQDLEYRKDESPRTNFQRSYPHGPTLRSHSSAHISRLKFSRSEEVEFRLWVRK